MPEEFKTRLKAKLKKAKTENDVDVTEVKLLITHPMQREIVTEEGTSASHFIEEVKCEYGGKVVMSAIWSAGISKNPYCAFRFKGGAEGEEVKLTWKDNKRNTKVVTAKIK